MKEYEHAAKAERNGDRQSAIEHLSNAVAIDPEFWEALNDLGVNFLLINRFDLGTEQLTKAVTIDPHAALTYTNLAMAFMMQKRFAEAERIARQAVSIDHVGMTGPFHIARQACS